MNYYFHVDSGISVTISTSRHYSPILTSEGSEIGQFYYCSMQKLNQIITVFYYPSCLNLLSNLQRFYPYLHFMCYLVDSSNFWSFRGQNRSVVWKKKLFVAFPWEVTSTGTGGLMVCVFSLWWEHRKAQLKVVLCGSRESNLRPLVYKAVGYPC